MKKLDLKNEEVENLLYDLVSDGYTEYIISGEIATAKKRNTFYTCERIHKKDGKSYKSIWRCASFYKGFFDGAENVLEDIEEFYEL